MTDTRTAFDDLPGDLMMWVLIVSELVVFGAGLIAFLSVRITDPAGFAEAQAHLHRAGAGVNTIILVTSGWLAALAVQAAEAGAVARTRLLMTGAALLGVGAGLGSARARLHLLLGGGGGVARRRAARERLRG